MLDNSGITWEAIGMTVTIIATLGIPMLTFVYIFGRRQGSLEEQVKTLATKDADHEKKLSAHEEEFKRLMDRQAERDKRLYDKMDSLVGAINTCSIGIAALQGYQSAQSKPKES